MASLKEKQLEFTAHIRQPERNPRPGDVEEQRMAIYRELLYNNVESFIASTFPVLRSVLNEENWHGMVRKFFAHHRCSSPLFLDISREFLDYLNHEREPHNDDPPFMWELAHYEWVELAVSIDDTPPSVEIDSEGDLLEGEPVLAPSAWSLTYAYPVHRISPEFQPAEPGEKPTYLLVHRDTDDEVRFVEINAVTAQLLELISGAESSTGLDALRHIAAELGHPEPAAVIDGGADILKDLRNRGVILGTAARGDGCAGGQN